MIQRVGVGGVELEVAVWVGIFPGTLRKSWSTREWNDREDIQTHYYDFLSEVARTAPFHTIITLIVLEKHHRLFSSHRDEDLVHSNSNQYGFDMLH